MTIPAVTSSLGYPPAAPIVSGPKTLGSADFMKLLAVQFQQQDPMKPMDDTAFIAQMAQFTSLSQTQTMATQLTQQAANSYLGFQVTVNNGDGSTSTGIVKAVQMTGGVPRLMVGNASYGVSSVLLVTPAPAPSTAVPNVTTPGSVSNPTPTAGIPTPPSGP